MAQPRVDYDDEGPDEPEEVRATLVEHLEELRARIMRSLFILAVAWVIGWFLEPPIFAYLEGLMKDPSVIPKGLEFKVAFTNFTEAFFLKLKLSFIIGLIIASPFIIQQLWGFIRPALRRNERRALTKVVPWSVTLFVMGVVFGSLILRPAFKWFLSFVTEFGDAALFQAPGAFAMFLLKMVLAFGIGFQMPVAVWFLAKVGLLTSETLWKQWRLAVGIIVILTFMLTPGGDVFSNVMLGVPLLFLYFITIAVIKFGEMRAKRRGDDYRLE